MEVVYCALLFILTVNVLAEFILAADGFWGRPGITPMREERKSDTAVARLDICSMKNERVTELYFSMIVP